MSLCQDIYTGRQTQTEKKTHQHLPHVFLWMDRTMDNFSLCISWIFQIAIITFLTRQQYKKKTHKAKYWQWSHTFFRRPMAMSVYKVLSWASSSMMTLRIRETLSVSIGVTPHKIPPQPPKRPLGTQPSCNDTESRENPSHTLPMRSFLISRNMISTTFVRMTTTHYLQRPSPATMDSKRIE